MLKNKQALYFLIRIFICNCQSYAISASFSFHICTQQAKNVSVFVYGLDSKAISKDFCRIFSNAKRLTLYFEAY